ncbi:MAG: rhodanese [Deltaproteobacteria bacterium]|nr:rhodanese [Deltaproteobacteria bacterium]
MPAEILVTELDRKQKAGDDFVLVDCREQDEHAYCRIQGATLIPLSLWTQEALSQLDHHKNKEIVIYCHHGMRSWQAGSFLEQHGFSNVKNLSGGIEAWSLEIDPKVKRY